MTKQEKPEKSGRAAELARREARVAAALRANLQRRKAQSRGRAAEESESQPKEIGKKAGG